MIEPATIDQTGRFAEIVVAVTTPNDPAFMGPVVHVEFQNAQLIPAGWSFYTDPGPADWVVSTVTLGEEGIDHCCTSVIDPSGNVREAVEQN